MSKNVDAARTAYLALMVNSAADSVAFNGLANAIVAAQKLALYCKRRSEIECSYNVSDLSIKRAENYVAREAKAIAEEMTATAKFKDGLEIQFRFGGDPRSPCGWMKVPGLDGDGWAREDGFPLY